MDAFFDLGVTKFVAAVSVLAIAMMLGVAPARADTTARVDAGPQTGRLVFSVAIQDFPVALTRIYYRRVGSPDAASLPTQPGFFQHRGAFLRAFDDNTVSALNQAGLTSKYGSNDLAVYQLALDPGTYEIYRIQIRGTDYPMIYSENLNDLHLTFTISPARASYIGRMSVVATAFIRFSVVFTDQRDADTPVAQRRFGELGPIDYEPIAALLPPPRY